MPSANVKIRIKDTAQTDRLMARLPIELRNRGIKTGLRAAANIVKAEAVRLCPKPGYPGDKPDKVPLNKTIGVKVVGYEYKTLAIVGPKWISGGNHGHLVEYGHVITQTKKQGDSPRFGHMTRPRPFMRPAADTTEFQQRSAIIKAIKQYVRKQVGMAIKSKPSRKVA